MDKTTLRQKSKKELLNIANELGLKVTTKYTIDMLVESILEAHTKNPPQAPVAAQSESTGQGNMPNTGAQAGKKLFPPPLYANEEVRELPKGYGDTKIVAMVRDPHWVFVYWEINHEKRQILAKMGLGTDRLVLRAYDITGVAFDGFNANSFLDIEVSDDTDNWYVRLPSSSRTWCIDLGVIANDGSFVLVARSNTVVTPREIPSERKDKEPHLAPSEAVFNVMLKITAGGTAAFPMSEEGGEKGTIEGLAGWAESGGETSSGLLPLRPSSDFSSSALASSFDVPREPAAKDFWLLVNTELIVYGATEPNAQLTIQGQPVRLRQDGTFSVRFALPDGEQVIPVRAVNADGDMTRCITPIVKRTTETE
jgi:hypothetical protein